MASIRWDPWQELATFERQLDQWLGRHNAGAGGDAEGGGAGWAPAVDVHQEGDTMVICADAAGVDPSEVDVSIEDDTLTISGSRSDHREVTGGQWIRRERQSGRFSRSIRLPSGVDPARIEATAANGVIRVRVPLSSPTTSHRVPVRTGAGGGAGTPTDIPTDAPIGVPADDSTDVATGNDHNSIGGGGGGSDPGISSGEAATSSVPPTT